MSNNISCNCNGGSILSLKTRWFVALIIVASLFFIFKGFIVRQILNRAISYYGFDMYQDAVREYKKVLLLERDNEEALNWMAYSYAKMGRKQKAIEIYKKAITFNPRNYCASLDLGLIYLDIGDFDKAEDILYHISLKEPKDDELKDKEKLFYYRMSLHWLATIQLQLSKTDEAVKTYKKLLEFSPDDKKAKEKLKELLEEK